MSDEDGAVTARTSTRFREPEGEFGPGGIPREGPEGAERHMVHDDDDDRSSVPIGLIVGCLVGFAVLLALLFLLICLVRRAGIFGRRRAQEAEPAGGATMAVAVIAPPLPPKKAALAAEQSPPYEMPAPSYIEPKRSYTNLAFKKEEGYPEPPPAYDNALYESVESAEGNVVPPVPPKGPGVVVDKEEEATPGKVSKMKALFEG